jgi:non-ribosomal peptide synthetase component F
MVADEQPLTYAELNARANQLARHLRELGVGPDSRGGDLRRAWSGHGGRAAGDPQGWRRLCAAGPGVSAGASGLHAGGQRALAVLVQGSTRSLLGDVSVPVIDLDQPHWQSLPTENLHVNELTPNHTAYVIYTSGSTGQPKGVINEHRGVVNRLLWMQDAYQLTASDTVLQRPRSASTSRCGSSSGR